MKRTTTTIPTIFFSLFASIALFAQQRIEQSEEIGQVHWYRDYDKALAVASEEGKDVLLLFQEVPGCSTCRNYGHNVLSHPLMVEAIESLFVPLAIFNNKGGKDKKVLDQYGEPSWNNPVVRIVDEQGKDVVKRIGNDYSALTLCKKMIASLLKSKKEVPEYLTLLEQELDRLVSTNIKEKTFKMYCFWSGEKALGALDGVLSTQAGFSNHSEVVKVQYDSRLIQEEQLTAYAKKNDCSPLKSTTYKLASNDVHYYLQHTDYKYLPLTEVQKTKINSALGNRKATQVFLSPRQKERLSQIQKGVFKKENVVHTEFTSAWSQGLEK